MFQLAKNHSRSKPLKAQAVMHLGRDNGPNTVQEPEVADDLYVQYVAARLSTPVQGGDPDLHAAVSLSLEQYDAARRRYNREFSEMAIFRHLRTKGAPHVEDYTGPSLAAVARKAPPGYTAGQSEQGDAGGEEPQLDGRDDQS